MSVLCELEDFYLNFKGEKFIIGRSALNRPIYCIKVKKTNCPLVIVQYAIHAREYITTYLALKQITDFIENGKKGCVYFLPALNPDGIFISLTSKPLYKANARGVDLNVNFDARWGTGQSNVKIKGDENFIGEYPFSEPETLALRDFTLKIKPNATISYHSKGEEIYYDDKHLSLAKKLASVTGYQIKKTPNSAGGYKDWCVEKLKIPAFTIEVGRDELVHPLKISDLDEIYNKNKGVITALTENIWWIRLKSL